MAEKISKKVPIQWIQTIKDDGTYEFNPDPNVYSTQKNIPSTNVITLQSTVIDGIDTTNRFLYNSAGTAVLSWESLNLTDQYGVGSIDWGGRALVSTGGNRVLNWQNDLNLISPVYYTSEIVDITQNIFSATSSYAGKTIQGSSSAALYNVVAYDKDTFTWNPVATKSTQATYVLGIWLPGNLVLLEGELVVHDDYGTFGPYIAGHIGGAPIYLQSDGVGVMDCTPPTVSPNIVRVLGYTYYKNTTSGGDWIMKFSPQDYVSTPTIPASSSYATSASYALTAQTLLGSVTSASYATSASFASTASFVQNAVSSSFASTASFVASSSYALSSSFASTASFLNSTTNAFIQNGNSFGTTALLGTNDSQSLALETSGSTRMFISSSGNIGIGTTSPYSRFTTLGALSTSTSQISIVNSEGGHTILRTGISGLTNSGFSIITADVDGTNQNTRLVISSTGNVGIGTTSPTVKLDVSGSAKIRSAAPTIQFDRNGSYTWNLINGDGTTYPTSTFNIANNAGTSVATFLDNGNVGIGTTTPNAKLDISGSLNISGSITQVPLQVSSGSTSLLFVSSSGNVGIGTSTPGARLDVFGTGQIINMGNGAAADAYIDFAGNRGKFGFEAATGIRFQGTSTRPIVFALGTWGTGEIARFSTQGFFGLNTNAPSAWLHISGTVASSSLFRIDAPGSASIFNVSGSGNIGIGTATPNAKLDINGNTIITGSLAISASIFQYSNNTAITSGSTANIASFSTSSFTAGFFDFVATSGTNARAGTVFTVWNANNVEYAETSTNDIGNTTNLLLSASLSAGAIRLQGTSLSGSWNVKTLTRMI